MVKKATGLEAFHCCAIKLRLACRKSSPGFPINSLESCPGRCGDHVWKPARASSELAKKLPFGQGCWIVLESKWIFHKTHRESTHWEGPGVSELASGKEEGMGGGKVAAESHQSSAWEQEEAKCTTIRKRSPFILRGPSNALNWKNLLCQLARGK